jgi:hypothetical protein
MTDAEIKKIILASHMRSEKKIVPWVRERLRHVSEDRILAVLEKMPHDKYMMSKDDTSKHYYIPIFTPFIGGFQIDLLEQSHYGAKVDAEQSATKENQFNPFFLVAINVNTKYAYAYPMKDKSQAQVLECLNSFAKDVKKVGVGKLARLSTRSGPRT